MIAHDNMTSLPATLLVRAEVRHEELTMRRYASFFIKLNRRIHLNWGYGCCEIGDLEFESNHFDEYEDLPSFDGSERAMKRALIIAAIESAGYRYFEKDKRHFVSWT